MMNMLGLLSANLLFSPPEGWTLLESGHAVKDASAYEKGELLQISTTGNQPNRLGFALMERGFDIRAIALNPYGHAELTLTDRLGHARWSQQHKHWTVFVAGKSDIKNYELESLFKSIANQALLSQANPSQRSKGWIPESSDSKWRINPNLVGRWGGSSLIKGLATHVTLLFESDGTLRIERSVEGKTKTINGKWMTHNDNLKLIYSNQSKVSGYRQLGSTLQFEFDQANVTFYKK